MSATGFLVLLIVSIAILMVLIMKVKLHPTFALFLSALFMGLVLGRFEAEGFGFTDILTTITGGFGGTLGSIHPGIRRYHHHSDLQHRKRPVQAQAYLDGQDGGVHPDRSEPDPCDGSAYARYPGCIHPARR